MSPPGPGDADGLEDELDDEDELEPAVPADEVLLNHPPLGLSTSAVGLVVALPLLVGGGFLAALAQGLVRIPTATNPPDWLLLASLPCAVAGLLMTLSVVLGTLRTGVRARAVARAPEEPWLHDYGWHDRRGRDRLALRFSGVLGALLFAAFVAPYNLLAWQRGSGDSVWIAWLFLGLFDLIALGVLIYTGYALLRRVKYRGAALTWPGVPFLVGRPVQLTFRLPAALRALPQPPQVVATLRCLSERWQTVRNEQGGSSSQLVAVPRHQQELRIGADTADDEGKLHLTYELPGGLPGTDLLAATPVYWELEVLAETPGIDYRGLFLVPVY